MTRCTCLWREDFTCRVIADPDCPAPHHCDDEETR